MTYAAIWNRLLQPAFERLRGKATPRLDILLNASQWWGRQQIEAFQWRQALALLEHASAQVEFYSQWFARKQTSPGELVRARSLAALPVIDKAMLMAEPRRFQARTKPKGVFAKATGGSTGAPLKFLVDPYSDHWRQAASRRGYAWAGCMPGMRQIYLWGSDIEQPPLAARLKRDLHRFLLRQNYVDCFDLDQERLDQTLALIDRYHPKCLVAYTSPLFALARRAVEAGWRPSSPITAALTGAEPLFDNQRRLIASALGCPVYETYGSREFMLIASECPERKGMHISSENLMVELLAGDRPAEPGELGEVVVTDLHNFAQPFIRYRTGDLAVWAQGDCACGRALPRLERVEGRILDMIRSPGGRILPGEFFPHFLKDFPAIEKFQVRQTAIDRLVISLVLRSRLSREDRKLIIGKTNEALPGVEAQLQEVDEIPLTAAGKHRVAIGLKQEGRP